MNSDLVPLTVSVIAHFICSYLLLKWLCPPTCTHTHKHIYHISKLSTLFSHDFLIFPFPFLQYLQKTSENPSWKNARLFVGL